MTGILLRNQLNHHSMDQQVHTHTYEEASVKKGYQSFFVRLLSIFLVLSLAPFTLYVFFSVVVYIGQIRTFLPIEEAETLDHIFVIQTLLTVLLVFILVAFTASVTSSSLIRPLRRLLYLTHLVGEGKLNYRLKISRSDEIGELTSAFNSMITRLKTQKARERLIEQLKSEFISVAAHQLRTPLSAIKWTFQMLIDGDMGALNKEQKQFLQQGYKTNEHMIGLVNDLLDASRIEQGNFGYEFEHTDFVSYTRNFIALYQPEAMSRSIRVVLKEPSESISSLFIDKAKMDLVFQNILDNSIKYSSAGTVVTISIQQVPHYIEVVIVDQGVGIPQHQIDRVFTKFFRGDNVVRMDTKGTGLGLFIVKNIVKNHGGDIRITSEENKGTTVTFTIPSSKDLIPQKEILFEDTSKIR